MEWTTDMIKGMLARLEIEQLNEMQRKALTVAEQHDEIVLYSPTGTGKTLAYLLPLIKHLQEEKEGVQALVIVPSRELAIQIESVFKKLFVPFKVNSCYGGNPLKVEMRNLQQSPALLIGTPGRIADHLRRESFAPGTIHTLVLDEFDKSLEFGFQKEMEGILSELEGLRYKILTSATRSESLPDFVGLKNPSVLDFLGEKKSERLTFKTLKSKEGDLEKTDLLFHLLCRIAHEPTLVFCNHRAAVTRISQMLWGRGVVHEVFQGGMEQQDRERALVKFRNGSTRLLVTTDLAARGMDIPDIKYVVHFQIPYDEKSFTHRNGRTARVQAAGVAYFIMGQKDYLPDYIKETPIEEFRILQDFLSKKGICKKVNWA
jgi:ATP-independent RNA helicase DbpA